MRACNPWLVASRRGESKSYLHIGRRRAQGFPRRQTPTPSAIPALLTRATSIDDTACLLFRRQFMVFSCFVVDLLARLDILRVGDQAN